MKRPLAEYHRETLEQNLRALPAARPDFLSNPVSIREAAGSLDIVETEGRIEIVRVSAPSGPRILFQREGSEALLQGQKQALREAFQRRSRFIIIAGVGIGHAALELPALLRNYPHSAAAVFEPDISSWAAILSLFDAREIIGHDRIYLFDGPDACKRLAEFIIREYVYLLPAKDIAYLLGALPIDPLASTRVEEAKALARRMQDRAVSFDETITTFQRRMARPLDGLPQSVWCCVKRDAYIHHPIAEAFLNGFSEAGLQSFLEPFDSAFTTNFRVVGSLFETQPDFFFFINGLPMELLEDIGLAPGAVESIHRSRACFLVDDTTLYEDEEHPPRLGENDWVFCAERTYRKRLRPFTQNTAFIPVATMFKQPGTRRDELFAPIVYVGSLPGVQPYLRDLPTVCVELIECMEKHRRSDSARSFTEHLQSLNPQSIWMEHLYSTAKHFCASTSKGLKKREGELEYFLYNCATYFKRKEYVEALLPLGLKVYGPDTWLDTLPDAYRDRYGGFVPQEALADCYASSQLCLNIHSHQCPTCLNTRDFDAPMAGGAVLGDWVEDMDRGMLEPGKETITFQTIEEAADTAKKYLNDVSKIEEIRKQGQERIIREHIYVHRAKAVLEILRSRK